MLCPRCGTEAADNALMCKKCGFHFDEPYGPQVRKQHSLLWWLVVLWLGSVIGSMLLAAVLYFMVMM
jgi:uncharacterized membrane protein YvbJ